MRSRLQKLTVSFLLIVFLAACGGGGGTDEEEYLFDFLSYDDYSTSVETYNPPVNQISFFPLALHFRTITKSYVSKVGTSANRAYVISGEMTTPTVTSGVYAAKRNTTVRYQASTLFEGISVTPISYEDLRYDIKLNGVAQANVSSQSTSYFDTTYGIRIGSRGSGYYKVLDPNAFNPLPEAVTTGQSGEYMAYLVYSDATKSSLIGRDVLSYNILSTSVGASGEYTAKVEYIVRSYSSQNVLLGIQTSTDDIFYSSKSGAASKNVSVYVDDISGTTTSRLLISRTQ
jgi:hypothetical protein